MSGEALAELIRSFSSGTGGIAVVEGEPGIGKTTLVESSLAAVASGPKIVRVRCVPARLSPLYELVEGLGNAGLGMLVADRPPRLEALYVMTSSGLLAARLQRQEGLDADIFSGMLTAVRQFVADSMGTAGLSRLDSDPYKILILPSGSSQLVAIVSGSENEFLRDDLDELAGRVAERFGAALSSWDGTASALAGLEDELRLLLDSGRYEGLEEAEDEPRLKRERLYSNIVRGIRREAKRNGLVLFIDDAQWADEGTVALLQPLGLATIEEPLAILLTVRPGEAPEHLVTGIQRLTREAKVVRVILERRDATEIARILESRLGAFDPALVERIREEGGGNPLYCLEIARYLQEKGMVEPGPQGFRAGGDAVFEIPSKARDIILARVSNLDPAERRTLEFASVLGDKLDRRVVLQALGPAAITGLESIERKHRLIRGSATGMEFDHAWTRDAVYESIGEARRPHLHAQAAQSIEVVYADEERRAAEVAEHWRLAGETVRARTQFRRAAKVAAARYENDAAAAALRSALDLAPDEEKESILSELALVLEAAGKYAAAQEAFASLVGLAEGSGDFRKVAEWKIKLGNLQGALRSNIAAAEEFFISADALLEMEGDTAGRVRLATARGSTMLRVGEYARAEEILRGAIEAAREAKMPPMEIAAAENPLAGVLYKTGRVDEALALMNDCVRIWREAKLERRVALGYHNIALIHKEKGEFDRARELLVVAQKMAEKVGSINTLALTRFSLALVHRHRERFADSQVEAEKAAQLFRITGDLGGSWKAEAALADALMMLRRHAEALPHAERAVRDGQGRATPAEMGDALNLLAAVRTRSGDAPGGSKALAEASRTLERLSGSEEHRRHLTTVAELALERSDPAAADAALKSLSDDPSKLPRAESANLELLLGRLESLRGRHTEALVHAEAARKEFAALKMEISQSKAAALAEACAAALVTG